MAIPDPWADSTKDSTKKPQSVPNGAREPEPEPERDRARAREAAPETAVQEESGEVVPFPGTTPDENTDSDASGQFEVADDGSSQAPNRWRAAAVTWVSEARETATHAVDGSVWRARPPALRDIHARAQRAEWSGGIPALRKAGQWFGYVTLGLTALGYALLWLVNRPARLVISVLITVLIIVFAF